MNFYRDIAGFELVGSRDALEQWRRARAPSGGCELRLSEPGGPASQGARIAPSQDEGWPAIHYFYPEDVVALHGEIRHKGFQASDLRVTVYGMEELALRDPDGHILWFGQETDEPPGSGGRVG